MYLQQSLIEEFFINYVSSGATRKAKSLQGKWCAIVPSYFKILSIGPSLGIEQATYRYTVQRSNEWSASAVTG